MKILYFLLIFAVSLFLTLSVSPLRGHPFGMGYSSLAGLIVFFFLTFFSLKKFSLKLSAWKILFALILGLWILQLPVRIIDFESTLGSLPDALIHTLGIICGYFSWSLRKSLKALPFVLGIFLALFMFFQGYDLWYHKLNFGTFTGKVSFNLPAKFEAFDEQKNIITDENFRNKLVLLDFWTTSCGICFEKFPQLQSVREKYKNDSSIMILAVDSPIEEDKPDQAFNDIREKSYSFPVVIAKDADLAEKFGVKGYPTIFVIDQKGMIIYKGDIAGAVKTIDNLRNN